jgi:Ca-activated chloride channel family protein
MNRHSVVGAVRQASVGWLVAMALAACGGEPRDADASLATLTPVRGAVRVGDERAAPSTRLAAGDGGAVVVPEGGLARVAMDAGPRLLLGSGAKLAFAADEDDALALTLSAGRAFLDVPAGVSVSVKLPRGTLSTNDAALSLELAPDGAGRVYVVRGEAAFTAGTNRGNARAGEVVALAGGGLQVTPQALWSDWTGGLARPGPEVGAVPPGMGQLEARVPDELGAARWPLVIRNLDVRVVVTDDLAVTEVDQEFFNPASETVEGLYRIRVPEGAVLSRFAVDRGGRLVDGYVREKETARAAYQAQVYRGSTDDPALLEWDAPESYRARIYPIAPGETRRIVTRYAEWLRRPASGAPRLYRYPMGSSAPLARVPHVQELGISVDVTKAGKGVTVRAGLGATIADGVVRLSQSDVRPRADFWLELEGGGGDALAAYRAEHEAPRRAPGSRAVPNEADERDFYFVPVVLPERVRGADAPADAPQDLVVVADVSAATDASHLELGRSVVESLVAHLGPRDRVAIVTSDVALRGLANTPAALGPASPERVATLLDALARTAPGGATDLGGALADAGALCGTGPNACAVVYVGDGAPTVGELEADALLERLGRLPRPLRLYALGVGAGADLELLEALTRGGGLALRVEDRAGGAEAALRVLGHAARPLAQRVVVELGAGIDNVFPRRPMDVVVGEVLPVVGRVRGEVPKEIVVSGLVGGRAFRETLKVETRETEGATDLRLRWAGERLRQLLLERAGRESVAELGTRYGLITPFTSFYVPSARELREMGESARLLDAVPLEVAPGAQVDALDALATGLAVAAFPITMTTGCALLDRDKSEPASRGAEGRVGGRGENLAAEETEMAESAPPPGVAAAPSAVPTDIAPAPPPAQPVSGALGVDPFAAPSPSAAPTSDTDARLVARESSRVDAPAEPEAAAEVGSLTQGDGLLGRQGTGRGGGGSGEGTIGLGGLGTIGHGGGEGYGRGASDNALDGALRGPSAARPSRAAPVVADEVVESTVMRPRRTRGGDVGGAGTVSITTTTTTTVRFTTPPEGHRPSRCSEASRLPLADRRALWSERLDRAYGVSAQVDVYRDAVRSCEAAAWSDRRALLELLLGTAGDVATMIQVYRYLDDGGARNYLRGAIARRVRTPGDLRAVREAFGLSQAVDQALVEQVLARATTPAQRIAALRQLAAQQPDSFDLKLRLLSELEAARRLPEARRLAEQLRRDPLADAGVRTAIGEMYLRLDDEAEARRVFSEIVEFAPEDELARRRLGDLYRAHGWFDDAYRQYQTLASIRPDDPSVSLLLAQAAAGAGRVDEALRLEQKLTETAAPGASAGLARTALLWSSVRYAELRKAARESNDAAKLAALGQRMRRSGVLREAGALRVSLVWSHPDAGLSLWAGQPGGPLARPDDLSPEYGLEAFDVREQEPGAYAIEVRRTGGDPRTTIEARLVAVWNEGTASERVTVVPLRFDATHRAQAWRIRATELADAPLSEAAPALGGREGM